MPHKSKCLKTPSYYGEDEVNAQNCLIPLELNWGGQERPLGCAAVLWRKKQFRTGLLTTNKKTYIMIKIGKKTHGKNERSNACECKI